MARTVAVGREAEFHGWAQRLTDAASRFPGFLGWGLLKPSPEGGVWDVVYRFASEETLEAWERSPERRDLLAAGEDLMETVATRRLDGMDAWFEATPSVAAPPRWKTFAMTATVIILLQNIVATAAQPLIGTWPTMLRTAFVVVLVVALMTWLVMPRISRLLRRWLYGRPS